MNNKEYYSLKEVSGMLGLARKTIYAKIKNREFPRVYKTHDGKYFFAVEEVNRWIRTGILPSWVGIQKQDPKDITPTF